MVSPAQSVRWQELGPLQPSERWLLIRSVVLLPITAMFVHWFGFRRCFAAYGRLAGLTPLFPMPGEPNADTAERIAAIIAMANERYAPYKANCLPKSMFLWYVLRSQGISADFQIGVRTITGPFEAHAWVEYEGSVLDDAPNIAEIYQPFDLSALMAKVTS